MPTRRNVARIAAPRPKEPLAFSAIQQSLLTAGIHFIWTNIQTTGKLVPGTPEGDASLSWCEDVYLRNKEESVRYKQQMDASDPAQVCRFILSILHRGTFSVPEFIIAIIYLCSFKKHTGVLVHLSTWRPLVIVLLLLADKMWEDKPMRLGDMAQLFPVCCMGELRKLEHQVAQTMGFHKMIVSPYEFSAFCDVLLAQSVHPEIKNTVATSDYAGVLAADGGLHHDLLPVLPDPATYDREVPLGYHDEAWTVFAEHRAQSPSVANSLHSLTAASWVQRQNKNGGLTNCTAGSTGSTRASSTGAITGAIRQPDRQAQPDWTSARKTLPVQGQQKSQQQLAVSRRPISSGSHGALQVRGGINQFSQPPPSASSSGGVISPSAGGLGASTSAREAASTSATGLRNLSAGQVRGAGFPGLGSREAPSSGRSQLSSSREGATHSHSSSGLNASRESAKRPEPGTSLAHSSSGPNAGRDLQRQDAGPSSLPGSGRGGVDANSIRPSQFSPRDNLGKAQVHSPVGRISHASGAMPPSTSGAQLHRQADNSQSRSPERHGAPVSPASRFPMATPRHVSNGQSGPAHVSTPSKRTTPGTLNSTAPSVGTPQTADGPRSQAPRVQALQAQAGPRGRATLAPVKGEAQGASSAQAVQAAATSSQRDSQSAPADAARTQQRQARAGAEPSTHQPQREPTYKPQRVAAPAQAAAPGVRSQSSSTPIPPSTLGNQGALAQRGSPVSAGPGTPLAPNGPGAAGVRATSCAGSMPSSAAYPAHAGVPFARAGYGAPPPTQGRRVGVGAPPPAATHQGFMNLAGRERSSSPAYQVGGGSQPVTARPRVSTPTGAAIPGQLCR